MTTNKKWWSDSFPSRYYAYATSNTLGGYPVAGLTDLDIYSKQPAWLTSNTTVVALKREDWLSIVPVNLIIKDGKVQPYVAPTATGTGTNSDTATSASKDTSKEPTGSSLVLPSSPSGVLVAG